MLRALFLVSALLASTLILAPAQPASADDLVSAQIDYALAAAPEGTQTAWNQVTWPDGTVLVAEPATPAVQAAASTCPSGKFCAHADLNGAGTRLEFMTCPSDNSVAALVKVRSISNARTTGTVTGRSGSTVVISASAGTTKNVTKAIDKVVCS